MIERLSDLWNPHLIFLTRLRTEKTNPDPLTVHLLKEGLPESDRRWRGSISSDTSPSNNPERLTIPSARVPMTISPTDASGFRSRKRVVIGLRVERTCSQ